MKNFPIYAFILMIATSLTYFYGDPWLPIVQNPGIYPAMVLYFAVTVTGVVIMTFGGLATRIGYLIAWISLVVFATQVIKSLM